MLLNSRVRTAEASGRGGVLPGAERHEEAAVGVEREVAVHHGGEAERADALEDDARRGLDVGRQLGIGRAHAGIQTASRS